LSGAINPKPLSALNHFTVPVAIRLLHLNILPTELRQVGVSHFMSRTAAVEGEQLVEMR